MKRSLCALLLVSACSTTPDPYMAGFSPPPVAKGFQRFIAPVVHDVEPGADAMYCQWVAAPSDVDRQVIQTTGWQSKGGHHIILYATTDNEPVGTSRLCTSQDMLNVTFIGGTGGEGGLTATPLPDGFAFDLPKGMALMANTHYLNVSDSAYDAQSVADVQFADPKHPLTAVGMFVLNWDQFQIPTNNYTGNAYCTANHSVHALMWANHMHEWGVSARSEVIHQDGTTTTLSTDDSWSREKVFNPAWTNFDPSNPVAIQQGERLHLQCNWNNTTGSDLLFPNEMCVGIGFVLESIQQDVCEATAG